MTKPTLLVAIILAVLVAAFLHEPTLAFMAAQPSPAATPSSSSFSRPGPVGSRVATSAGTTTTATTLYLFGQQPKDDGSPGDYVCKDCGYVFTKGPKAWAALDDNYKCPPCGAPKFRFKKVPKGSASGKVEVKKSWFGK